MKRNSQIGARRVLVVGSLGFSLVRFRGNLIQDLVERGYTVIAAAPDIADDCRAELNLLGAETIEYPLSRHGLNPFKEAYSLIALYRIIKTSNVDIVFSYTLKPVLYSSLAGRACGIPVVSMISGLGLAFTDKSRSSNLLRFVLTRILRLAISKNASVIFQNEEDRAKLRLLNVLPVTTPTILVNGSGVDLEEFNWRNPRNSNNVRFVLVARLIVEKGILLYAEAARVLRKRWPDAEFHLVGGTLAGSESSIDLNQLDEYISDGSLIYHGWCDDLQAILSDCDVFVLPTWYAEGVPRSILEAMAIGLAIVTSDTPGCRTTVKQGLNGLIVKPNDLESLVKALQMLLSDPTQIESMSIESRNMASELFDVKKINSMILDNFDDYF